MNLFLIRVNFQTLVTSIKNFRQIDKFKLSVLKFPGRFIMVQLNSVIVGLVGYCIFGASITCVSMRFSFSSFAILMSICAILHETHVPRINHLSELQGMLADSVTCLGVITVLSIV